MSKNPVETIRQLTEEDAAQYYEVRLRALREHPEAFGSPAELFEKSTIEEIAERFRTNSAKGYCIFGAFMGDQLVGLSAFGCSVDNPKVSHRGGIYQMYVAPEARGRKFGSKLLEVAIDYARQFGGVEELILGVEAGNRSALALYQRAGFEQSYTDRRSIKIGDTYHDIESMTLRLK